MMYTAKPPYSLICTSACCLSECVSCDRWFNSLPFPCFHCHHFISCTSCISVYCGITHTIGHHTFIMWSGLLLTCLLLTLSLDLLLYTPCTYFAQLVLNGELICEPRYKSEAFLSLSYLKELC